MKTAVILTLGSDDNTNRKPRKVRYRPINVKLLLQKNRYGFLREEKSVRFERALRNVIIKHYKSA